MAILWRVLIESMHNLRLGEVEVPNCQMTGYLCMYYVIVYTEIDIIIISLFLLSTNSN